MCGLTHKHRRRGSGERGGHYRNLVRPGRRPIRSGLPGRRIRCRWWRRGRARRSRERCAGFSRSQMAGGGLEWQGAVSKGRERSRRAELFLKGGAGEERPRSDKAVPRCARPGLHRKLEDGVARSRLERRLRDACGGKANGANTLIPPRPDEAVPKRGAVLRRRVLRLRVVEYSAARRGER